MWAPNSKLEVVQGGLEGEGKETMNEYPYDRQKEE
jgi:hypothetical protein